MKALSLPFALTPLLIIMGWTTPSVCTIKTNKQENSVLHQVDRRPEYTDGSEALIKHLTVEYQSQTTGCGIRGRTIIRFMVHEDGTISDAQIVRSVDPVLDKLALQKVNTLGRWQPAIKDGKSIAAPYTVSVKFIEIG